MTKFLLRGCWVLLLATSTESLTQFKFNNSDTGARLPKPMSDVSAVVGPDNLIYIAGGCDSPFGSQYDDEVGAFRCSSVSNAFYAFDPETQEIFELPPMPEGRFRHAAVSVNNQIWLVGGRNQYDELVGNVHVSEIARTKYLEEKKFFSLSLPISSFTGL
jgi:Kelch motif